MTDAEIAEAVLLAKRWMDGQPTYYFTEVEGRKVCSALIALADVRSPDEYIAASAHELGIEI
jgi:hypothetical protein